MPNWAFGIKNPDGTTTCTICFRNCKLREGLHGFCYTRKLENNQIVDVGYGQLVAAGVQGIETTSLLHFYPCSNSLALATPFCSFGCQWCYSKDVAHRKSPFPELTIPESERLNERVAAWVQAMQPPPFHTSSVFRLSPEEIVAMAQKYHVEGLSWTSAECDLHPEFMVEVSSLAKRRGLYVALESNSYVTRDTTKMLEGYVDSVLLGMKGSFDEEFGRFVCNIPDPQLQKKGALAWKDAGAWLEVIDMLLPDGKEERLIEACKWYKEALGDIPILIGPVSTILNPPVEELRKEGAQTRQIKAANFLDSWKPKVLHACERVSKEAGLNFIYPFILEDVFLPIERMSVHGVKFTTRCPSCLRIVLGRYFDPFQNLWIAEAVELDGEGDFPRCKHCGEKIAIKGWFREHRLPDGDIISYPIPRRF